MRPLAKIATCAINQWSLDFDGNRDRIIRSELFLLFLILRVFVDGTFLYESLVASTEAVQISEIFSRSTKGN